MKPSRLTWLLLGLATTAALAAFGEAPADKGVADVANIAAQPLPNLRAIASRVATAVPGADPFAVVTAAKMLPSVEMAAVLPAPTFVATLPWRVIGKQAVEGEGWMVFLAQGNATRVVGTGEMLDEVYRVERIAPPTLTLLHTKNKTRRTLDIGEAKE